MKFELSKNTTNFLKVMSAIMVMLHHYAQYVCANHISDSVIYKSLSYQAGFLGVAVFFFLSGYGLMESEQRSHLTLKNFLQRRILKVYLPVLTITLIWMFVSPFLLSESRFEGLGYQIPLGGGNSLTLSNILIDFGDGVLWFIKALIILYCLFYIFSAINQWNKTAVLSFLCIGTILVTILIRYILSDFQAISVPLFSFGIYVSLFKNQKYLIPSSAIILTIISATLLLTLSPALVTHAIFNFGIILLTIILLSTTKIDIKIPAALGAISFDLYLVHNKVLMSLKDNMEIAPLSIFIFLTIAATILFYAFRTKLLKI